MWQPAWRVLLGKHPDPQVSDKLAEGATNVAIVAT
jgi:hypothetical protein